MVRREAPSDSTNIRRGWVYAVPVTLLLAGLGLGGYYGWDYAKQTVFRDSISVPQYKAEAMVVQRGGLKDGTTRSTNWWKPAPKLGEEIGRLSIPRLGLTVRVVQGTDDSQLKLGAGHTVDSALPGQGSNVFVAGHRDTVFTKLKDLKKGDKIVFSTPYGDFVYEAADFQIVSPYDTYVMAPTDFETLTISTCYPFDYIGPAPKRYIIYTKLVSEPKG